MTFWKTRSRLVPFILGYSVEKRKTKWNIEKENGNSKKENMKDEKENEKILSFSYSYSVWLKLLIKILNNEKEKTKRKTTWLRSYCNVTTSYHIHAWLRWKGDNSKHQKILECFRNLPDDLPTNTVVLAKLSQLCD